MFYSLIVIIVYLSILLTVVAIIMGIIILIKKFKRRSPNEKIRVGENVRAVKKSGMGKEVV